MIGVLLRGRPALQPRPRTALDRSWVGSVADPPDRDIAVLSDEALHKAPTFVVIATIAAAVIAAVTEAMPPAMPPPVAPAMVLTEAAVERIGGSWRDAQPGGAECERPPWIEGWVSRRSWDGRRRSIGVPS